MDAVAVVATLPVIRATETWQYGDPSLTDLRISLLDRGQSDGVTRRKRTGSSRHSWRWSWKQMFTKPFQNQTWTRGGILREKGNRKKRKSESQDVSKNSVETRKKMDELYRIWLCEADESSEESSDDEFSERNRRRSCYPRIFGSDSSSSDSDTDSEVEEHQVSEYVREGPSRIKADVIPEEERISEDLGRISDTSSQASDTSDSSLEINLIQIQKQGTINEVVDLTNPELNGYQNSLKQTHSLKKYETNMANNELQPTTVPIVTKSLKKYEVVEMKKNTVNSEPQLTIVSHPITKTADIKAIAESPNPTNYELQSYSISQPITKTADIKVIATAESPNPTNYEQQSYSISQPIATTGHSTEIVEFQNPDLNSNNVSHDSLLSSQKVSSEGGHEQAYCHRVDPGVMTSTRGMINNCRNGSVISVRQVHHQDIFKRVDELCAQCGDHGKSETTLKFFGVETGGIYHDNTKSSTQEDRLKKHSFDGNSFDLDSPQVGCRKESIEKSTKDVVPDYPSSYPKTGTHQQMSSQNEEQYSKLQCEFKRFGCQFSGTNMAVDQHMQSSLNDHLKLVSKLAQDQKEQLETQQLEQQKQNLLIQQLTDTVNNLEKLVREQNQVTQSQDKTVHSLKDQMKDQRKQNQRFEREITNQIQSLNESPTSSLPTTPCAAEFVWPIKNFRKRLRRIQDGEIDDPLISEPFYTGAYGYKFSIWVYLNGRGKTLGDWVSVYARVMPSDHDNILSWPVRPMYTFTLLDQSEGEKEHIVRKRKVNDIRRDGGKHHGIHRPEGGERSVIVGFDDFVAHAQLEKRKYMVEDCIYLKLEANIMY